MSISVLVTIFFSILPCSEQLDSNKTFNKSANQCIGAEQLDDRTFVLKSYPIGEDWNEISARVACQLLNGIATRVYLQCVVTDRTYGATFLDAGEVKSDYRGHYWLCRHINASDIQGSLGQGPTSGPILYPFPLTQDAKFPNPDRPDEVVQALFCNKSGVVYQLGDQLTIGSVSYRCWVNENGTTELQIVHDSPILQPLGSHCSANTNCIADAICESNFLQPSGPKFCKCRLGYVAGGVGGCVKGPQWCDQLQDCQSEKKICCNIVRVKNVLPVHRCQKASECEKIIGGLAPT